MFVCLSVDGMDVQLFALVDLILIMKGQLLQNIKDIVSLFAFCFNC